MSRWVPFSLILTYLDPHLASLVCNHWSRSFIRGVELLSPHALTIKNTGEGEPGKLQLMVTSPPRALSNTVSEGVPLQLEIGVVTILEQLPFSKLCLV